MQESLVEKYNRLFPANAIATATSVASTSTPTQSSSQSQSPLAGKIISVVDLSGEVILNVECDKIMKYFRREPLLYHLKVTV